MIASQLDLTRPFILLIPDVLSPEECSEWIARIKASGPELATINTTRGAEIATQVRNNRRVILDDADAANNLFDRVRAKVPQEIHGMQLCGVNERLRCYEYHVGQRFAPHSDGAFIRSENEQSWYTFMIYLNEGCGGGETNFFVEPEKSITPTTGMALLFQHPIIHEGAEVTSGSKYVVRTDLMYRKD